MKTNSHIKFFTFLIFGISTLVILLHFAFFQIRHPAQIGAVTTDIVILAIIVVMLFETSHLSRVWRHPFIWINIGILLFFVGSLSELLGGFFVKPNFTKYTIENGSKIFAFGILAWGFFQWGKEKIETGRRVEKLKEIDGLTDLPNRSSFHRELKRYEKMGQKYMDRFSLTYLNIDNFKKYNEDKGESAGDALLQKMAHLLSQNVRSGDLLFRYGPDEFVILIPMVGKEIGERIPHRIRALVENEFKDENVTVSVAAAFYEPGKNIIKQLQETMQKAKATGKNRVCLAD
ncbi:MAG: GGDEF domain-containing protein [Candidatus Aerophobetes bacterium]|nr:GGDEF domain-containing protein [Candidatus Aerophobetes bacterium]